MLPSHTPALAHSRTLPPLSLRPAVPGSAWPGDNRQSKHLSPVPPAPCPAWPMAAHLAGCGVPGREGPAGATAPGTRLAARLAWGTVGGGRSREYRGQTPPGFPRTAVLRLCGRDKLQTRSPAPSAPLPALAPLPPPAPCQSRPFPGSLSLPGCKTIDDARLESCGAPHSLLALVIRQMNPSGKTRGQLKTGGLLDSSGHRGTPRCLQ